MLMPSSTARAPLRARYLGRGVPVLCAVPAESAASTSVPARVYPCRTIKVCKVKYFENRSSAAHSPNILTRRTVQPTGAPTFSVRGQLPQQHQRQLQFPSWLYGVGAHPWHNAVAQWGDACAAVSVAAETPCAAQTHGSCGAKHSHGLHRLQWYRQHMVHVSAGPERGGVLEGTLSSACPGCAPRWRGHWANPSRTHQLRDCPTLFERRFHPLSSAAQLRKHTC